MAQHRVSIGAQTTMNSAPIRVQIDRRDIDARCDEHQFAAWLSASYLQAEAIVLHRAREATHLATVFVGERPAAFMLGEIAIIGDARTLYLGPAAVDPRMRRSGLQHALFDAFDAAVAPSEASFTWGVTAHPASLLTWVRHFPQSWPRTAHALPAFDESPPIDPLACWRWLGVQEPSTAHPFVRRHAFSDHGYTEAELSVIAAINHDRPTICSQLDAAAGDRLLLVALRE